MTKRHKQWMARYGRVYQDATEKEKRYKIFEANVEYIDSFNNAGNQSYKLGVNEFADLTNEEFRASHNTNKSFSKKKSSPATSFRYRNFTAVPQSIDWRKKGAVTPIRDELCGAWTFSAVDTVEGLTKIKTGTLYTLSVQEIVDCNSGGYRGCTGGFTYEAFEFIKQHGLTSKANYPSKTENSTCDIKKEAQPVAKITGYEDVPANSEEALLKTLANQPVAVTVDASGASFQFYSSGVFTADCGTNLDHSVTAIGYGTSDDNGLKYWLIKNAWGTSWGEEGYMRMQRDIKAKGGKCGIAMEASYPTA
ncbi:senescence-specific cysteine protease SAG39-like [Actinidia eriantha]|uniref:senescence-specific cysteine protease SAG39-like n=1 Tax=Actinidia eriantha TaxID=165200 RepID=UPI00258629B4|nr:senescence-specific cysteine protease SAG39-like [Actinidia eriantha]